MKRSLMTGVALTAALMSAMPAGADDTPDPVAEATAAADAQARLLTARAGLVTAEAGLVRARSDALGLPTFSGKTTTDATTGVMESWILSGGAINAAAAAIAAEVNPDVKERRTVLIVDASETLKFGVPATLLNEMGTLQRSINSVRASETCEPPAAPKPRGKPSKAVPNANFGVQIGPLGALGAGGEVGAAAAESAALPGGGSILPFVGAVLSALKTETTVTGQTLTPDGRTLIDALAGKVKGAAVPTELVSADAIDTTRLGVAWNSLVDSRNKAFACRTKLAPFEERDGVKARVALLDSVIQSADAFAVRVAQSENGGPSQLVQAALLDTLAGKKPLVLRVSIEQAGGSLWKRDSLWTMFGFSGVRLTGGLIVSYRLTDPATGGASRGGLMVCRTDFASMKKIQAGSLLKPDCAIAGAVRR